VRRSLGTMESAATMGGGSVATWMQRPISDAGPTSPVEDVSEVWTGARPLEFPAETTAHAAPAADEPEVPPLVQLRRTYLMFEGDSGVVLIDQHSAHERVLYEQFMGAMERGSSPSQRLLFPLTLALTPAEADALEIHREDLRLLGYEMEEFGGQTVIVHAVPSPHPRFDAERCLRDTLSALTGDRVPSGAARHQHLAATVACKAAVKAGEPLAQPEMRALFIALRNCTLPAHDVHGRSTIVHLAWDELERRFGRR